MASVEPQLNRKLSEFKKLRSRLKALCNLRKVLDNNGANIASSFVWQGMKLEKFYVTKENFGPIVTEKLKGKGVKEVVLCKDAFYKTIIKITDSLINKLENNQDINSINLQKFDRFITSFRSLQTKYAPIYEALLESVKQVKDTTRINEGTDILRKLQQYLLTQSGAANQDQNHEIKLDLIRRWCVASLNHVPSLEEQENIISLLNLNSDCETTTLDASEMQEIYNSVITIAGGSEAVEAAATAATPGTDAVNGIIAFARELERQPTLDTPSPPPRAPETTISRPQQKWWTWKGFCGERDLNQGGSKRKRQTKKKGRKHSRRPIVRAYLKLKKTRRRKTRRRKRKSSKKSKKVKK
jgi:hypothetical protein